MLIIVFGDIRSNYNNIIVIWVSTNILNKCMPFHMLTIIILILTNLFSELRRRHYVLYLNISQLSYDWLC